MKRPKIKGINGSRDQRIKGSTDQPPSLSFGGRRRIKGSTTFAELRWSKKDQGINGSTSFAFGYGVRRGIKGGMDQGIKGGTVNG